MRIDKVIEICRMLVKDASELDVGEDFIQRDLLKAFDRAENILGNMTEQYAATGHIGVPTHCCASSNSSSR